MTPEINRSNEHINFEEVSFTRVSRFEVNATSFVNNSGQIILSTQGGEDQ